MCEFEKEAHEPEFTKEQLLPVLAAIERALELSDALDLHDTGCALDSARVTVEARVERLSRKVDHWKSLD